MARLATRKAKPDGFHFLRSEDVDDFIRDLPVTSLPGETQYCLPLVSAVTTTRPVAVLPGDNARLINVSRRGTRHGQEVGRYGREVVRGPPAGVSVPAAKEVWTPDRTNAFPLLQRPG